MELFSLYFMKIVEMMIGFILTDADQFLEESLLVRFFYYMNIITAIGLIYLFKRAFEVQELGQKYLDQLSKESRDWIELPGITS